MRCYVPWAVPLLAVVLLAGPCGAGAAVGSPGPRAGPAFTVSGAVLDSFTGSPVGGASVGTDQGTTTTAATNGTFLLTIAPAPSVLLRISAHGYHRDNLLVPLDANVSDVVVELDPFLFPVTGVVLAENGSGPVPGAEVSVHPGTEVVSTSENGSYRLLVPNGTFTLVVAPLGSPPFDASLTVAGQPVRSPPLIAPTAPGGGTGTPGAPVGAGSGGLGGPAGFAVLIAAAMLLAGALGAVTVLAVGSCRGTASRRRAPDPPMPLAGLPAGRRERGPAEARRSAQERPWPPRR